MKQITDNLVNYPQIADGFCYSGLFGLRPMNGTNWFWNCLAGMEKLRVDAEAFRPRQWMVPKNFTDAANANAANIAPGKTVFYQFQVKPGSYLWGLTFAVFDNDLATSRFSIQVREIAPEIGLSDRQLVGAGITAGTPSDPFNTLYPPVTLLPEPRLILAPGQISVEVSNDSDPSNDNDAVSVQLLLLFAEPK